MLRYLFVGLLLAAIVIGSYVGCGPQLKVAGQKAIDKINELLGEIDVKLAEIESQKASLESGVRKATEARVSSKFHLENLGEKKAAQEAKKAKNLAEVKRLVALIEKAGSEDEVANDAGRMVTKEALQLALKERLQKGKAINANLNGAILPLLETYEKNMAIHTKNEKVSRAQLAKIETKIAQLKAEKERLDTMKQTKVLLGNGESISDSFDKLEKSVDDLLVEVKTQNEIAEESVDRRAAAMDEDTSLDELLGSTTDEDDSLLSDAKEFLGDNQ